VAEAVALADRAIVMRPRPGRLDDTVVLPMRRPRDPAAPTSEAATRTILSALDHSLRPRDGSRPPQVAGGSSF
jgi:sulfonate transport system ATP-binding protein